MLPVIPHGCGMGFLSVFVQELVLAGYSGAGELPMPLPHRFDTLTK